MDFYILKNGKIKKATDQEYAELQIAQPNWRRVDFTSINGEVEVSTVFLSIDHNWQDPGGPPILFETMVFGGEYNQYHRRYSNLGMAKKGHWQIVDALSEGRPPESCFPSGLL